MASVVYCAKRRTDGALYAVKRLKRQLETEAEQTLQLKEVAVLAAFPNCPYLLKYYSSWIDDGYLHIQTEFCQLGNLETLVGGDFRPAGGSLLVVQAAPQRLEDSRSEREAPCGGLFLSQNDSEAQSAIDARDGDIAGSQMALSQIETNPFSQTTFEEVPATQQDPPKESHQPQTTPEVLIWKILKSIGSSLAYLHSREVAHLDIRPANIFVGSCLNQRDGGESGTDSRRRDAAMALNALVLSQPYHPSPNPALLVDCLMMDLCALKLGDLGQCCNIYSTQFTEGETRYCPREVINGDLGAADLSKADIFSLGATCYELCLGRSLGAGGEGALEWHSLRDGFFDESVCLVYSKELVGLLRAMMHGVPTNRPSAQQVVDVSLGKFGGEDLLRLEAEIRRLREENSRLREAARNNNL